MENASKALIVAAAVLMAILIISMGMYIYNKSSSVNTSTTLDGLNVQAMNQTYLQYEGIQIGSNVKNLLSQAAKDNEDFYKDDTMTQYVICICSNSDRILKNYTSGSQMRKGLDKTRGYGVKYPENIRNIASHINNNDRYRIEFNYNENTGLINEIWINEPY